jgi:transposase-like protein
MTGIANGPDIVRHGRRKTNESTASTPKQAIQGRRYTPEEKEAIIAEFSRSGKAITTFIKERGGKPAYQVFKGWIEGGTMPKASGSKTPSALSTDFMAEFEAEQEAARNAALKQFLNKKRKTLVDALAALDAELAKLEPKPEAEVKDE